MGCLRSNLRARHLDVSVPEWTMCSSVRVYCGPLNAGKTLMLVEIWAPYLWKSDFSFASYGKEYLCLEQYLGFAESCF